MRSPSVRAAASVRIRSQRTSPHSDITRPAAGQGGGIGQVCDGMRNSWGAQHPGQTVGLEHLRCHQCECEHRQVDLAGRGAVGWPRRAHAGRVWWPRRRRRPLLRRRPSARPGRARPTGGSPATVRRPGRRRRPAAGTRCRRTWHPCSCRRQGSNSCSAPQPRARPSGRLRRSMPGAPTIDARPRSGRPRAAAGCTLTSTTRPDGGMTRPTRTRCSSGVSASTAPITHSDLDDRCGTAPIGGIPR